MNTSHQIEQDVSMNYNIDNELIMNAKGELEDVCSAINIEIFVVMPKSQH